MSPKDANHKHFMFTEQKAILIGGNNIAESERKQKL